MSRSRAARVSITAVFGLASLLTSLVARHAAQADTSPCGREWSSAVEIGHLPGGLVEVSGFVSSSQHPGVAWMIRDSDNPRSLYSFELEDGRPRWKEFPISGVSNDDWEDLAYTVDSDGRGRLWILENVSRASAKRIYEVLEPDPESDQSAQLVETYRFDYPNGSLNTEAMVALGGRLVVVAKTNPNGVYRLPAPLSRRGENQADYVGRLDAGSFLTMASTSADDRLLVTVGTNDVLSVFDTRQRTGDVDGFVGRAPIFRRSMPERQREAGDFFPYSSCDIVLVSEDASVWRFSNPHSVTPSAAPEPAAPPAPLAPEPAPHLGEPVAPAPPPPPAPAATRSGGPSGYWILDANGGVYAFGDARHLGEPGVHPGAAAVDLEPTSSSEGYWVVDARGVVHAYGDARRLGDAHGSLLAPGETVTSLSRTPTGEGYWLFTSRGRALTFGDAGFFGDLANTALNGPVLDSIATPTGLGYYMVASDGGVFAFGDARFHGSMGGAQLNAPVQSLVPTPGGGGYWLVASDGGVFSFGAPFLGSLGGMRLNRPVTAMVPFGNGYLMVGEDGGVFNFSDRPFSGSLGDRPPAHPVVSAAALSTPIETG